MKYFFLLFLLLTTAFAEILSFTTKVATKSRLATPNLASQIHVTLNQKALKKDQLLSIDLPENLLATFENTNFIYRGDGDFSWAGKPNNGSVHDRSLFTTKNGSTYGIIIYNGNRYVLKSNSDGTYKIFKENKKPSVHKDDFLKLPPREILQPIPTKVKSTTSKPNLQNSIPSIKRSPLLRTTNSIINVLILYTQAYADYYEDDLSAQIQYSIDYANIAMSNSNIALTYNLAHQALYENSQSNETIEINDALLHISGKYVEDGYLYSDISINEDIRKLRAIHNIDITSFFRLNTSLDAGGEVIGLGWMPNELTRSDMRQTSYNVSEYSDDVFAHESGHNFGCAHDRDTDGCSGALFSYSCGFRFSSTSGTIMSYSNNIIQFFSNPDLYPDEANGAAIGEAESDCSRTIEETKATMAINNDITEANEDGDTISNLTINGNINPENDRDWYQVNLGGATTIHMSSQYSNIAFQLNLYDNDGFLIDSYVTDDTTITLENGTYNLIIANEDDVDGSIWYETKDYSVTLTSNYVEPLTPPAQNSLVPIITYLLF